MVRHRFNQTLHIPCTRVMNWYISLHQVIPGNFPLALNDPNYFSQVFANFLPLLISTHPKNDTAQWKILCNMNTLHQHHFPNRTSSGSSGRVRGGPRNMKSMRPPSAAIFFMTYFYRAGGGMAPSAPPPDPLLRTMLC